MDIVWIPCSVGSSLAAEIIVVTWFQYYLNTSAALTVVTVDGTELQLFRNALDGGLLHIEGIVHILVFLQSIYHCPLDGWRNPNRVPRWYLVLKQHLVVHDGLHEIRYRY